MPNTKLYLTSWNGNTFHTTGFCGESTGQRWILPTKNQKEPVAQSGEIGLWSEWVIRWTNSRIANGLRSEDAHVTTV